MKNIIKTIACALLLFLTFNLTSCWQPIFYELRKDVKPEEPTVSGVIPNITRYTADGVEYLFLSADGGIRYKPVANNIHGSWFVYPTPFALSSYDFQASAFVGQQVISVFANSDTLYILSAEYASTGSEGITIPSKINLWGKTNSTLSYAEEWKLIDTTSTMNMFPIIKTVNTDYYTNFFNVFQTNSPMPAHRHTYICSYDTTTMKYRYFELNGTNPPVEITIPRVEDALSGETYLDGSAARVYSAAYLNGSVRFYSSRAVVTDETFTEEAKHIYYGESTALWYTDGTTASMALNAGEYISCLEVCSDAILIGRGATFIESKDAGIVKTTREENGTPGSFLVPFATNASFQITEAYTVLALLNATPGNAELASSLYSSVSFYGTNGVFKNIGLWSYYPERGNWNRE